MKNLTDYTQSNRAAWDASAAQHEGGERWRRLMAGFAQPGFSAFDATATDLLRRAGVKGSRVVQAGCNIGGEVLSCPIRCVTQWSGSGWAQKSPSPELMRSR